jgi:hypothetical protein
MDDEDDDIAYDWRDDEDYYEPWKDPFYGYEPDPEPPGCWWCDDRGCRRCVPSRWQRIRWALRGRLDRLLRRGPKADDPWGSDEGPF